MSNIDQNCCATTDTANYPAVRILKPGVFNASNGQTIALSAADLEQVALNFDPAYLVPTINIDHQDCGPALGQVEELHWDGEFLLASIAGVPHELAAQIDAGAYPSRSAELYLDLDGRGPSLRAVALLGAQPPAVKGLGPMLRRLDEPASEQQSAAATGAPAGQRMNNARTNKCSVAIFSEVVMEQTTDNTGAAKAVALAEENRRLQTENRQLKLAEQRREVAAFTAELRAMGKLTPALEQAGLEQVLLAVDQQPLVIQLAEGQSEPLGAALRRVFSALPCSVSFGELDTIPGEPADCGLSADERQIAAQLGLTEQEYSEIRRLNN
jgi:phage I-like protein